MQVRNVLHDDITMEFALLIDNLALYKGKQIEDYEWQWGNPQNGIGTSIERIKQLDGRKTFNYIYFGNEFCEYRIPSLKDIERCISIAKEESLRVVLVTPPVTDYGLSKLEKIFDYFITNETDIDIVVNDYGVLELLKEKQSNIGIIMGRVMDKTSHDSRASEEKINNYYGKSGLEFARTPGVISLYTEKVLENYDISRYEFDMPLVGLDLKGCQKKSLYWPYNYLTTGRVCSIRSYNLEGKDKYLVGNKICDQGCRNVQIEKHKPINGYGNNVSDIFLFERGNTVFYVTNTEFDLNEFDRIIIQV